MTTTTEARATDIDLTPEAEKQIAVIVESIPQPWRRIIVSLRDQRDALSARLAEVEAERDELRICAHLHMDLTNHHNAARCPYCNPELQKQIDRERECKSRAEAAEARLAAMTRNLNAFLEDWESELDMDRVADLQNIVGGAEYDR